MAHLGNTVVNGALRVLGGEYVDTINGVTVGDSPKFSDTTYTAATAAPGAIASSGSAGTSTNYARQDHTHAITVGTGDNNGQVKVAGQNASVKGLGSAAYTASTAYATSGHTHGNMSSASAGFAPKGAAVSSQSQSTKFLREDGSWAAPSYTTNTNTTYTFANGTNGFTVTPSGGTAQTVTVTPSITNNVTGSGTSGYIAKFNGGNTITNGPAIGSDTTKYLRNDGTWVKPPNDNTWTAMVGATSAANGSVGYVNATPPKDGYNTKYLRADGTWTVPPNDNTTYSNATTAKAGLMSTADKTKLDGIYSGANAVTIAESSSNGNIKVTTNGSTANVPIHGLGSAAYTASTAYAGSGHTHTTSMATSSGTNQITLAANTKYAITAGGTSYVFTTPPDTNTWRGIQNNLTSDSTSDSLSAAQGKALANGSARDNTKLPLSGGTLTGQVKFASTGYRTADDNGYSTDQYGNFKSLSNNSGNCIHFDDYNGNQNVKIFWSSGNITSNGNIGAAGSISGGESTFGSVHIGGGSNPAFIYSENNDISFRYSVDGTTGSVGYTTVKNLVNDSINAAKYVGYLNSGTLLSVIINNASGRSITGLMYGLSDAPTTDCEYDFIVIGERTRATVYAHKYNSNGLYKRTIFADNWHDSWTQIMSLSGNTLTLNLI